MKRRYKIYLIILVIQFISVFFYNSYAAKTSASTAGGVTSVITISKLSKFVDGHGLEDMTEAEKDSKLVELRKKMTEDIDQTLSDTVVSTADRYIQTAKSDNVGYEKKMEILENAFATITQNNEDENAPDYLYYGYSLGWQWTEYKESNEKEKSSNNEGKTNAQLFDEVYSEYENLSNEEKNDVSLVENYREKLEIYYDKLTDEEKEERQEKVAKLYDDLVDAEEGSDQIYQYPNRIDSAAAGSLDDVVGDADDFLAKADGKDDVITQGKLQSFSQTFYNILLTIGIVVAVLAGLIIGIKFMEGGVEEKAEIKELLIPYLVGCIVVFGAFAIWKIAVTILSEV